MGINQVLIDERKGRKVARDIYGLRTLGTVRVLLEAKQSGLIDSILQPLESMRENDYPRGGGAGGEGAGRVTPTTPPPPTPAESPPLIGPPNRPPQGDPHNQHQMSYLVVTSPPGCPFRREPTPHNAPSSQDRHRPPRCRQAPPLRYAHLDRAGR